MFRFEMLLLLLCALDRVVRRSFLCGAGSNLGMNVIMIGPRWSLVNHTSVVEFFEFKSFTIL